MAPRTLPGLGLEAFFNLGEDGWNDEMDNNLLKLSVLGMLCVNSRVASVPGSPTNGDMHILTSAPNQYKIAVRDNGAWTYLTPAEGWFAYDRNTNNFVLYDGSTWANYGVGGALTITHDVFTTPGSNTWNKPAGLIASLVEVNGGGGGGGAGSGNTSQAGVGGGGGGGGYARKLILAASLGGTETATVGSGGAGGSTGPTAGSTGGTSSFGSHCSATGGTGGAAMATGTSVLDAAGGSGGTGSGGDVNSNGGAGLMGYRASGTSATSGGGGMGGGTGGGGGGPKNTTAAGSAGTHGGGGSGGASFTNTTGGGGAGGVGSIRVINFIQA